MAGRVSMNRNQAKQIQSFVFKDLLSFNRKLIFSKLVQKLVDRACNNRGSHDTNLKVVALVVSDKAGFKTQI